MAAIFRHSEGRLTLYLLLNVQTKFRYRSGLSASYKADRVKGIQQSSSWGSAFHF